jgi:hypothetical protein
MINSLKLILALLALSGFVNAQSSNDEQAVKETVNNLFLGMEKGDSALVHHVFASEVTMATILRDKNNEPVIRRENGIGDFLKAVGSPHQGVWYEEIWNVKVQLDGDFAQVWCDYAFYIDNTFSHCGVDALQLHRTKQGWQIFHLADTRRKQPCDIPAAIRKKHQ